MWRVADMSSFLTSPKLQEAVSAHQMRHLAVASAISSSFASGVGQPCNIQNFDSGPNIKDTNIWMSPTTSAPKGSQTSSEDEDLSPSQPLHNCKRRAAVKWQPNEINRLHEVRLKVKSVRISRFELLPTIVILPCGSGNLDIWCPKLEACCGSRSNQIESPMSPEVDCLVKTRDPQRKMG